jgi:Na+-transporting methylmalonyl-CoA/oxaloacetate decarboxylase gamma subunit
MDWLFTYADPNIDWDYAVLTLIVRFIGVFVVMIVMQVALQLSSAVLRRYEARPQPAPVVAAAIDSQQDRSAATTAAVPDLDDATAAAIGLALALETRAAVHTTAASHGASSSAWAAAGRFQQLNRAPR